MNRTRWIFIGILGSTMLILIFSIMFNSEDTPTENDPESISSESSSVTAAPVNAVEIEILTADTKAEWSQSSLSHSMPLGSKHHPVDQFSYGS